MKPKNSGAPYLDFEMWAFALRANPIPKTNPRHSDSGDTHKEGDDHFITFSCHNRKPYLNTPFGLTA
jgi:hypothetical protein